MPRIWIANDLSTAQTNIVTKAVQINRVHRSQISDRIENLPHTFVEKGNRTNLNAYAFCFLAHIAHKFLGLIPPGLRLNHSLKGSHPCRVVATDFPFQALSFQRFAGQPQFRVNFQVLMSFCP
mgnify:CR=1 FL=1